jgi:hypothetical protein
LADAESLRGDHLAACFQRLRDPGLHRAEIGQAQAVEQIGDPEGQRIAQLLKDGAEIELSRLDPIVEAGRLLHEGGRRQRQRQDDEGDDNQQRRQRGEVGALAHCGQQPPVERREHDGEHGCPQDRAEEGPKNPSERQGYRDNQQQ